MTSRHVAVWIDHHEARVFHVAPEAFDETTIRAPHKHIHRHPKGSAEPRTHPDDANRFFHEVTTALEGAAEVLIVGPSTAKLQFIRYAQEHAQAVARAIVGIETVDHPTDPQLVAYARQYFRAADRMH
jgi:stalled ribosome rescue protein Dom34